MGPLKQLLAFALAVETSLTLTAIAQAQPSESGPSVGLHWVREQGSEDCFDGSTLAKRVEQRRGARLFSAPTDADVLVEGRVTRTQEGYRAELRTFEAGGALLGSRNVVSQRATCAELSETVAVVLAVMLDPEGGALQRATPSSSGEDVATSNSTGDGASTGDDASTGDKIETEPAQCPSAENAQLAAASPQESALQKEVSAFGRYAYGHVPTGSFGGGVALELRFRRLGGARFEAVTFAEQTFELSGQARAGSTVRVLFASAGYCPLWGEIGRFRASACASLAAGALQSRGFGFDVQRDHTTTLLDAGLSIRGAVRLFGPVGLSAGAGVTTPMLRTQLEATTQDGTHVTLLEQKAFSVAIDLGLGCAF